MTPVVIDASVAVSWCFEDEANDKSRMLLEAAREVLLLVPTVWPLEVVNVVLMAERKGRIHPADSARFFQLLSDLPIRLISEAMGGLAIEESMVSLARRRMLTAYDAQYLQLAIGREASLATLDVQLAEVARAEGVRLWEPPGAQ